MQLVAGVAGALILGPVGLGVASAGFGFAAGSIAYGLFGPRPNGPGPGDLKRPQLTLGAQIPRIYGRVRRPVHVVWTSAFRATEHSAGGKGAPEGPSSRTYSLDLLGWVADGVNVQAITRVWVNNKVVWTALADSGAASIEASLSNDHFDEVLLLSGTSGQVPWSVYEDAVGAADAPAYFGVASVALDNLQCGSSKQLPFIEVECITAGTVVTGIASITSYGQVDGLGGNGSFGNEGRDVESFLDGASATGSAFLAYFVFERSGALPAAVNDLFLEVGGVAVWAAVINWGAGEVTRVVSVQLNAPVAHTAFRLGFTGSYAGSFNFGLFGLTGATVWRSVIPAQQIVESDDPAFGVVTDGAGNYRWVDVDEYDATDLWGSNSSYIDLATPGPVDLADIVDAELARVPGFDPGDWDSSDLVGVPVTGYTAVGSAHQVLADLGDIYHFDLVPGRPLRFVRRAAATVGSIPFSHTGAGVGEPGQPFAGLLIGNNDESPGVVGLTFPNVNQDHDVDFQSGDRLNTDGPDIRRVQTNVVMTPAEARGRAFSATVMQRSAAKTAAFGISDRYAAAEPGDAYAVTDIDGNTYNLRIKRFTYADGVKDCEWELNDISALVDELDTETDYTEAITVESSGVADWLALDAPLLRTADDNAGYYAAMKVTGDSPGFFYESEDDTTYTERGDFGADAVFGSVTSIAGTLTSGGFIDEYAAITVNVGEGELASVTRAALLGARTANAILIGAPGRWVAGQYRTATLSSPGVYVLGGLLLGDKGTEQYVASLAAGDTFALLTTAGWRRLDRSPALLGSSFYVKGVALRRPVTSVTGESFTNTGVALKPLSPVQLRKTLDAATGDASYTFNRRTRHETRFGGDLGDACPLGEESERYRVRFYADGTYATVVRETEVTSATFTYTGAQRTTDYGSSSATAYVGIAQLSATVGAGYELQAPA